MSPDKVVFFAGNFFDFSFISASSLSSLASFWWHFVGGAGVEMTDGAYSVPLLVDSLGAIEHDDDGEDVDADFNVS